MATCSGGNQQGGNLSGGNQQGGNLSGGNQQGGNLSGGNQQGGNLSGGNQQGGNLSGGNQQGGNRSGGNQQGGNLSGSATSKVATLSGGNQQALGSQQRRQPERRQPERWQRERWQPERRQSERCREVTDRARQRQVATAGLSAGGFLLDADTLCFCRPFASGLGGGTMRGCILCLLLAFASAAAVADESPVGISQIDTPDLRLYYYESLSYLVPHAVRTFTNSHAWQRQMFGWVPSEPTIILLQDLSDYGNANTFSAPHSTSRVST